jgi:hypothetical protein
MSLQPSFFDREDLVIRADFNTKSVLIL